MDVEYSVLMVLNLFLWQRFSQHLSCTEVPLIRPVFCGGKSARRTLPVSTTTWIISDNGRSIFFFLSTFLMYLQAGTFRWKKKNNKLFFIQFQISWTSDIFCVWRSGLLLSLLFGSEESGFCSAKETGTDEQQCHKWEAGHERHKIISQMSTLRICWEDKKPARGKMKSIEGLIFFLWY